MTGTLTPLPGTDRGYELHGERVTPAAPCSKCSSRSLPGRTVCARHDVDPIEGERFDDRRAA